MLWGILRLLHLLSIPPFAVALAEARIRIDNHFLRAPTPYRVSNALKVVLGNALQKTKDGGCHLGPILLVPSPDK